MNAIEYAFYEVPRKAFLPHDVQRFADADEPLPIGYGQTNSQPSTVRQMLEWLDAKPGDTVLDVGSGSGWTSALLAHITYPGGAVYAVEKVPELVGFGRENCERIGAQNVTFFESNKQLGLPNKAPFNKILVSASADKLPSELIDQLAPGGRAVVPVAYDILVINKRKNGTVKTIKHPGFVFVPLIP